MREAPRAVEARVEGSLIAIYIERQRYEVPFKLVKGTEHISAPADLHPALRALGVEADLAPDGVRIRRDGMWGLLAAAVEQAVRRGEPPQLPPGVSLLSARPEARHYVFLAEAEDGRYVYSVLYAEGSSGGRRWTAMGGKVMRSGKVQLKHAERRVAETHVEAISALTGRRAEVKRKPSGIWYFWLYGSDLERLGAG